MPLIWPAQKQSGNLAGFERALQFRGIDGVVLNRVSGTQHLRVFEPRDRLQNLKLHLDRKRRAHAVDVNLVRVQSLRLKEELVHLLVGKLHDLVFDRRTVSRTDRLDLPAVHGRAVHVLADDAMRLCRGPGDVARHLRVVMRNALGAKAERRRIDVARLLGKARPVDAASVEARRSSGLEPASAQAELLQSLAQQNGVGFARTSRRVLLLAAVNQAVEKCSGRDDDGRRADRAAVAQANAENAAAVCGGRACSASDIRLAAVRTEP